MRDFIFWVVLFLALGVISNVIHLVRGESVAKSPLSMGFAVIESVAWIGWGVYLLARG